MVDNGSRTSENARFAGRVVLVTGAGSGLGRATALAVAAAGGRVVAADLSADGLAETAGLASGDAATTEVGGSVDTVVGDVSTQAGAKAIVEQAVATGGGLDVLINVAGVLRNGYFTEMTEADVSIVLGVNLIGTMWMCQAAVAHLIESAEAGRGGNIVNIASIAGLMGQAYHALYCASKAAVVNLTRSLAMEYIKTPLRVNALAPGGIKTPMSRAVVFPDDVDFDLIRPYMGFRKMSQPAEIAAVVLFVASDAASAMTGSIVSADSGLTAA